MNRRLLFELVKKEFKLDLHGMHGISHWARVRHIGLELSKHTGAAPEVVELFSILHDSMRVTEGIDPGHGIRALGFASSLRGTLIDIDDHAFNLLSIACTYHSDGATEGDITVQTCWDADRFDLCRYNIEPNRELLCTKCSKTNDFFEWASNFSKKHGTVKW